MMINVSSMICLVERRVSRLVDTLVLVQVELGDSKVRKHNFFDYLLLTPALYSVLADIMLFESLTRCFFLMWDLQVLKGETIQSKWVSALLTDVILICVLTIMVISIKF